MDVNENCDWDVRLDSGGVLKLVSLMYHACLGNVSIPVFTEKRMRGQHSARMTFGFSISLIILP